MDRAEPTLILPSILSDHAVLQRDQPTFIRGRDRHGGDVAVHLGGRTATTRADANGRWAVRLPPSGAGGPHTMHVVGSSEIFVYDILFGDVWVGSGQSNMDFRLAGDSDYRQAMAMADVPLLRHFRVSQRESAVPESFL